MSFDRRAFEEQMKKAEVLSHLEDGLSEALAAQNFPQGDDKNEALVSQTGNPKGSSIPPFAAELARDYGNGSNPSDIEIEPHRDELGKSRPRLNLSEEEADDGQQPEPKRVFIEFLRPSEILAYQPPPNMVLIGDNHIVRGNVSVLGGPPGVGKSRATVGLAEAGAIGYEWFGLKSHFRFRTLIVQSENGRFRLKAEFAELDDPRLEDFLRISPPPPCGLCFWRHEFRDQLKRQIEEFGPDLIILDPWNAIARDERAKAYRETFDIIHHVIPYGDQAPALCIVAHTRKPMPGERANGRALLLAGSYLLGSVPRCVWIMQSASDLVDEERVVWTCAKNKDGELGKRSAWVHASPRVIISVGVRIALELLRSAVPGRLEPPNSTVEGVSGANLLKACASTKFRAKARFVSASASSPANKPASLQGFTVARPAQPAGVTGIAAKARPIPSSDPFGVEGFERSRAKTPQGYARAFNSISRELIGLPLTRKQQDEIRAQRPKLRPEEVDKNSYRHPAVRDRAPRDMPKRRKPGWVCRQFVLPRLVVEGLMFLAKAEAQEEFANRSNQPRGLRRAFPRTTNFYVTEALNALLADYGLSQFCVAEAEPAPGRVRRFAVPTD